MEWKSAIKYILRYDERNRSSQPILSQMARYARYMITGGDQKTQYRWRWVGRPLGTRILPSSSQFPTIRAGQHKEEAFFSSYEWNVLVYPALTHLLDSRNNLWFYIGQKASDELGQADIFQLEDLQSKVSVGREWPVIDCDFFLCTVVGWESFVFSTSCLWTLTPLYPTWTTIYLHISHFYQPMHILRAGTTPFCSIIHRSSRRP